MNDTINSTFGRLSLDPRRARAAADGEAGNTGDIQEPEATRPGSAALVGSFDADESDELTGDAAEQRELAEIAEEADEDPEATGAPQQNGPQHVESPPRTSFDRLFASNDQPRAGSALAGRGPAGASPGPRAASRAALGAASRAASRAASSIAPRDSASTYGGTTLNGSGGLLSYDQGGRPPTSQAGFSDGVRQERDRIERQENEIFQLKLKITLLEKNLKLGADAKELYAQLTAAYTSNRDLQAENAELRRKLEAEAGQRRAERDADERARAEQAAAVAAERDQLAADVAEQKQMLQTFVEAQDMYSQILDGLLQRFDAEDAPHLREFRPKADGESVDAKLAAADELVGRLVAAVEDAQDHYQQFEQELDGYLAERESTEARLRGQDDVLGQLAALFHGAMEQLPQQAQDLLANNRALEQQLQEHVRQQQVQAGEIETLRQKANLDVHAQLEEALASVAALQDENKTLVDAVARTSHKSYEITRQFFRRLTAHMGPEWGDQNDQRLRSIVEEAKRTQQSKLPMLVKLMLEYVDDLASIARAAEVLPTENAELDEKNKHLEGLLMQEIERHGADSVLLARYRELEGRLKLEQEKRKNEYQGYQRSLLNLSFQ